MSKSNIHITKASGVRAPYNEGKLKQSLLRAGATSAKADEVVAEVREILVDGMSTKKIYKIAFRMLRSHSRPAASRYKLKQALIELGPTGFPFELFMGELFKHKGFKVKIGEVVQGHCVTHEIDVLAQKDNEVRIMECKFHNRQGYFSDVKVPLYIQSRFLDVARHWKQRDGEEKTDLQGWVATNTRFSVDAIQYGTCMGLHLIGWDYPQKNGIRDWVDQLGLHPITSLTTITKAEKQQLLDKKVVLCRTLHQNPSLLEGIGIKQPRLQRVVDECVVLCEECRDGGTDRKG